MREPNDDCIIEMALPADVVMAPLLINDESRWIYQQYRSNKRVPTKISPMLYVDRGPKTEMELEAYKTVTESRRFNYEAAERKSVFFGYDSSGIEPL